MHICWTTRDILDRIADLPAAGPLPRRTIVVPRARVAHRLRCGLIQRGRTDLLAGTAFVTVKSLAEEVLQAAGVSYREGENELRPSRLHVLYVQGLDPEYFRRDLVLSAPGWEEALARTMGDLERAGLSARDLEQIDTPVGRGLTRVWQALDEAAGLSVTRAGLVARAAVEVERSTERASDWGSVLAVVSGYVDGVEAWLIRAIPGAELVLRAARPVREGFPERVEALFGHEARALLEAQTPVREGSSDLAVVQGFLFESPETQAEEGRERAAEEPDGSVVMEEHAGVAAEVEAAAQWVARQVLESTPLEEIAVLVPRLDPLAQLLSDRLQRLPWPGEGPFPVHVAGSCALTSTSSGGRMGTVLEALSGHLSVGGVAQVLPLLRLRDEDGEVTSLARGAALDLAQALGTVGGSVAHPQGALEWPERLERREVALAGQVQEAARAEGDEEQAGLARRLRDMKRLLRDLQRVRRGLEQLVAVAAAVLEDRSLSEVWPVLKAFLSDWVLPGEDGQALEALARSVEPACDDAMCGALAGRDALALIEEALEGQRVPVGRFGQPAVYVGTVSGAVGLPFQAVRVMGLVDDTIPAAPREDTVLPDELRERVGEGRVTTAPDVALRSLHELLTVVQDTGRELVLSVPRMGLARSYREPSSLFLEVAAALGRPVAGGQAPGSQAPGVPDVETIRRREFGPARTRAHDFRRDRPLGEAAWQDRAAEDRRLQVPPGVPAHWLVPAALDLDRIAALQPGSGSQVMEGILGPDAPGPAIPGMAARRPLSASRWRTFLSCPHHFLYEYLLGWEEPAAARPQRELDPLAYGSLFHSALEQFFKASGKAFWAQEGTLARWQKAAAKVAQGEFAALLEHYPLSGEAVRQQQLDRLRRELRGFLAYLWEQGPSRFVAAEQAFGFERAVKVDAGEAALFVRGYIDFMDVTGKATRIWDVKTGKCHPRRGKEEGPVPTVDAQIALYGLVAAAQGKALGATSQLQVAYAHTNERAGRLRRFGDDFDQLAAEGHRWLRITAALMARRSFPRSTNSRECMFCPFAPVCGPRATQGSAAGRADADEVLQAYAEMGE